MVKNAELILAQIRKINVQIDVIYKLLGPYKNYVKTEGSPAGGKCYACSPETSALNCHYIKKKTPLRLNGYFWIKTKCMPSAERVYCDFTTGDGNFYIYYGNLRGKVYIYNLRPQPSTQTKLKSYRTFVRKMDWKMLKSQVINRLNQSWAILTKSGLIQRTT